MNKMDLTKYVAYFTMGDGGLYYISRITNPLYQAAKIIKNNDYVLWQKSILENITSVSYSVKEFDPEIESKNKIPHKSPIAIIRTKSHPFFTSIHERLYIDGHRVIDPHYLKLMDWEALSILYQDDGSIAIDKRPGRLPVAYLHMNRYSYGDLLLVKKALKDKLNLEWNVQSDSKGHYRLQLRTKDYHEFESGIEAYILDSFKYKIQKFRTVDSEKSDDEIV